jgi:alpha-beta hydrolase superfamily lysophospholipase
LRMAGDLGPDVSAYSLVVPMVKIKMGGFPYAIARGMSAFYSATGLGEQYSPGRHDYSMAGEGLHEADACNANPDEAKTLDAMFILDERLRVGGTTHQWVTATTASTDHITEEAFLAKINKPVLMFTAGDDLIVQTPAAQAACKELASCEEVHFPNARHCITRETEAVQGDIYARTIAFFDAQARS